MANQNQQYTPEDTPDKIETLRVILEAEQHTPISYEDAQEIGETLIRFFEVLAEDSPRVDCYGEQ